MLHKEFWGLLFLLFVGWIFVPGNPTERIEHACKPIEWTGSVVTSLSALALPQSQASVQGVFDRVQYGCEYTAWRLLYQKEYNKLRTVPAPAAGAASAGAAASSAAASSPASGAAPASSAQGGRK